MPSNTKLDRGSASNWCATDVGQSVKMNDLLAITGQQRLIIGYHHHCLKV